MGDIVKSGVYSLLSLEFEVQDFKFHPCNQSLLIEASTCGASPAKSTWLWSFMVTIMYRTDVFLMVNKGNNVLLAHFANKCQIWHFWGFIRNFTLSMLQINNSLSFVNSLFSWNKRMITIYFFVFVLCSICEPGDAIDGEFWYYISKFLICGVSACH